MNTTWISNLQLAFDGSRYLAGQGDAPELQGWIFDASAFGRHDPTSGDEFLDAARQRGIARLELFARPHQWTLPTAGRWQSPCEFVVVAPGHGLAWALVSTAIATGPGMFTERVEEFHAVGWPETPQWSAPEAARRLRQLLEPWFDHPREGDWLRRVAAVIDGRAACEHRHVDVRPFGVTDAQVRLLCAGLKLSSSKLSGMGGLDDLVPFETNDLIHTVAQALAAATRSHAGSAPTGTGDASPPRV